MPVRVKFYPGLSDLINPYWSILQSSLERLGVAFADEDDPSFRIRWLVSNRQFVDVLHFHYVQQFYVRNRTTAQVRSVFRFARNLLIARLLGYKTVFTLHNLHPTYPLRPSWVDYCGHWAAANLTSSVIVHCEYSRDALAKRYGRRRNVYVVPHPSYEGVYPNHVSREQARDRLGLSEDHFVFVCLGSIRPNKGIDDLVTSFRQVKGESLRLIIAGESLPPAEYTERVIKLAAGDERVILRPELVPNDEIQIYLHAADVTVLPFNSVLTSGSTVLAMSFGKPVIAPALGCLPELVGREAGILYRPGDRGALTWALEQAKAQDLKAMGREALKRVEQFSGNEVARRTVRAYTD